MQEEYIGTFMDASGGIAYNWPERSLSYLCRAFDQLYKGQEYREALPVFHIGFLDFTLFLEHPEFYATYQMLNVKNYCYYSDKFILSVVDLNKINMATETDKAYRLDYWARLFKAKTWEELKMLVKDNEYLQEAADSIYKANADEIVRQQCEARKEAERYERTLERNIRLLKEDNSTLKRDNSALKEDNSALKEDNSTLRKENMELERKIKELAAQLSKLETNRN